MRDARETRGVSLDAVEADIKIRHKYLEAMENEDFGILPGRVYVKGFLKNYARYLGLEADDILSLYQSQYPAEEEQESVEIQEQHTPGKGNRRFLAAGLIVAGIVFIAAVFATLPLFKNGEVVNRPPASQQNDSANKGGQLPPSGSGYNIINKNDNNNLVIPPEPVPEGVNLTLNVTDKTSWMLVVVDGKTQFTGELPAGESKSFQGKEKIWIKLGNAGVVEVQVNGKKLGVLGSGVKSFEYTAGSQG